MPVVNGVFRSRPGKDDAAESRVSTACGCKDGFCEHPDGNIDDPNAHCTARLPYSNFYEFKEAIAKVSHPDD